jgi:hypothetical protein
MTDRPRIVLIGVPTRFKVRFTNADTHAIITGSTDGTVKLYDDDNSPPSLITTLALVEEVTPRGTYSVNVPFDQLGLVDGGSGHFVLFITGGAGFELTITGRCVYRSLTDDGK